MTNETILQLEALGINPERVAAGVTFEASGYHFKGAEYLKEKNGIKLFRTTRDGKFRMLPHQQMIAIFA